MDRQVLARNAVVSVGQVVISSIVLFILYRYLIKTIGVERLGMWSVVMASANAMKLGELGLSGSATKFVAKYYSLKQPNQAAAVVQTAALSLSVIAALILLIIYPLLHWSFRFIFPLELLEEARSILPFSLAYLWLLTLSGVFQSGLDGCFRTDLRGLLVIGSSLVLLASVQYLVPQFGLLGVMYAQLFQAFVTVLIGWMLLRGVIKQLPMFPHQWNYKCFKEILGYGANLQLINICVMLFEPVTKLLLGKFGGLSMAGYYEMAQRLVSQIRLILLAANQILVPVVAHLHETDTKRISDIYRSNYLMLFYLALPAYAGLVAFSPAISVYWLGDHTSIFVLFVMILSGVAFLHILTGPAYYMNLGTGHLKWNVIEHVVMSVSNLVLGILLGIKYGGVGVVVGASIALILGSSIVAIAYHIQHHIPFSEFVPRQNYILIVTCAIGMATCLTAYYSSASSNSGTGLLWVLYMLMAALVLGAMWFHPQRSWLTSMLKHGVR